MFYKLSNTAKLSDFEHEFGLQFEYPNVYKPEYIINGLRESNIPVITMNDPKKIRYAIWGLLPSSFEDNWRVYQDLTNTLNVDLKNLDQYNSIYAEALNERRCLVVVTGFFTSALYNGKMYPYHIHLANHNPFCIAGIYNQWEDGFITCSILVNKVNNSLEKIPNIFDYEPVVISKNDKNHWLNTGDSYEGVQPLVSSKKIFNFQSQPISKPLYDKGMLNIDIVDNVDFQNRLKTS